MDRRDVLRIGTAAGALYVGERLEVVQAMTTAAAKPVTSAYSGPMSVTTQPDAEFRLTLGVFRGKVAGLMYLNDEPYFSITGSLRKGRLKAEVYLQGERDYVYYTLTGRVRGASISGTHTNHSGGPAGTFSATKWKADPRAMKAIAGNYEGIVSEGPSFTGKCLVKPNGTFRLHDTVEPGGKSSEKPIPGYFVLKQGPAQEDASARVVGVDLEGGGLIFFLCTQEGCDKYCHDTPTVAEVQYSDSNGSTTIATLPGEPNPKQVVAGRIA
jgi:hypothetical protein